MSTLHTVSMLGSPTTTAARGRRTVVGFVAPDRVVVLVAVGAFVVVVVAVVVVVGLGDVDTAGVDDEFVLAAVTDDRLAGSISTAEVDDPAASAETLLIDIGSSTIGEAARTVTMRRLIETSNRSRPASDQPI